MTLWRCVTGKTYDAVRSWAVEEHLSSKIGHSCIGLPLLLASCAKSSTNHKCARRKACFVLTLLFSQIFHVLVTVQARGARTASKRAGAWEGARSPDVNRRPPLRIGLRPTQHFVRHRRDVAFTDEQLRSQLQAKDQQLTAKDMQIAKLYEDIESWREQVRYKELQIAQLQDRMIQLPSPEEPEPTEQGSEVPEPAAAQAGESGNVVSRFWRWFVGG